MNLEHSIGATSMQTFNAAGAALLVAAAVLFTGAAAQATPPDGRYSCDGVTPCLPSVSGAMVRDVATGLTWQREQTTPKLWWNAMVYCEALTLEGFTDWRLPNVKELLTLVDRSTSSPAIDHQAFAGTTPVLFWTSSPYIYEPGSAWYVDFAFGGTNRGNTANAAAVRCVR